MYLLPIVALVFGAAAVAIHLIEKFESHAHDAGLAHQAVDASLTAAASAPTPEAAAQHVMTAVKTQTTIAMPKAAAAQAAAQATATHPDQMTTARGWKEVLRQRALAAAVVALTEATNGAIHASIEILQQPGDPVSRAKLDGARQRIERAKGSIRALGGGDSIDRMTPDDSGRVVDMGVQNSIDLAFADVAKSALGILP